MHLLLLSTISAVMSMTCCQSTSTICDSDLCQCDDDLNVDCRCSNPTDKLTIGPKHLVLPENITSLSVHSCGRVVVKKEQLMHQHRLRSIIFSNIMTLHVDKDVYYAHEFIVRHVRSMSGSVLSNLRSSKQFDRVIFRNVSFHDVVMRDSGNLNVNQLLLFSDVSFGMVMPDFLAVSVSLQGQAMFHRSRAERIASAGIRISGGRRMLISNCTFVQLQPHSVEASTSAFALINSTVYHMHSEAIVVSAASVNISNNRFIKLFADHALSGIRAGKEYHLINNAIMPALGDKSLLAKVTSTKNIVIRDNKIQCSCSAAAWIKSDSILWSGLATSLCLNACTPSFQLMTARQFFDDQPCTEQHPCAITASLTGAPVNLQPQYMLSNVQPQQVEAQ